jgi:quaternary ammonium compound-resistance protein SugE
MRTQGMAWLILVVAGLLEIVWATALKYTEGFSRLWPSVLALGTAALSFVLLSIAMRHLPVSTAYAVWVGVGALGVALVGIVAMAESASPARIGFLLLVLIGIIGLKAVEG